MRRIISISAALFVAVVVSISSAIAGNLDFEQGKAAHLQKDFVKAHEAFLRAYNSGDAQAALWLGSMYAAGHGVKKDLKTGLEWYEKAASRGNAEAAFRLGQWKGGVWSSGKQREEVIKWYRMAAERGHKKAQKDLQYLTQKAFDEGTKGTSAGKANAKDAAEHLKLLQQSAEKGDAKSQLRLAELYFTGRGVKKNVKTSMMWLERAATIGDPEAQTRLAGFYLLGKAIPQDTQKGMHWLMKAVDQDHPEAQLRLGMLEIQKRDNPAIQSRGFHRILRAAKKSHKGAQLKVGELYLSGIGIKRNLKEGLMWVHIADVRNHPQAKQAKKVIKQKVGYTESDMEIAIRKAENCLATRYRNCVYTKNKPQDFDKILMEQIKKRKSGKNLPTATSHARADTISDCGSGKKKPDRVISDCSTSLHSKNLSLANRSIAHFRRGAAYELKRQYEKAIADFDKAIQLNPIFVLPYFNRGNVYFANKQYDRAIADFDKAIQLEPKYAVFYYNRGIAFDRKRQYDQAIVDFDKAIQLNPKYAAAYNNRGLAYENNGQLGEATADFKIALKLKPGHKKAEENLKRVLARLEK